MQVNKFAPGKRAIQFPIGNLTKKNCSANRLLQTITTLFSSYICTAHPLKFQLCNISGGVAQIGLTIAICMNGKLFSFVLSRFRTSEYCKPTPSHPTPPPPPLIILLCSSLFPILKICFPACADLTGNCTAEGFRSVVKFKK